MEKKLIGNFIASLRKANGYTQEELSQLLNVSNKTISSWENNNSYPDISMLPVLADIFHVTCDELLRGEKNSPLKENNQKDLLDAQKSEKVKKQLYRALETKYQNYIYILMLMVGIDFIFLLVGMLYISYVFGIVFFILGIALFIGSWCFNAITYNSIRNKGEDDNTLFQVYVLRKYTFGKALCSFFILTFLFYGMMNRKLLLDSFELSDSEKTIVKHNHKLKKIIEIPSLIIIVLVLSGSICLEVIDPVYFTKSYSLEEIAKMESTITCELSGGMIKISNGADYDMFTWNDLTSSNSSLFDNVTYELPVYYGKSENYTVGVVNKFGDNFYLAQKEDCVNFLYSDYSIICSFTMDKLKNGNIIFKLSSNDYYPTLGNKYVMDTNKSTQENHNIFYGILICLAIIELADIMYVLLRKKSNQ